MFTVAQVIVLLKTYGYLLIFPIAFVEGPIIAVICGWFAALGILNFFIAYILLIVGNLAGDAFYYAIGYWGGPPLIKKWGRWLRLDLEKTLVLKKHFDNHGGKILLWAKLAPDMTTTFILAGAGLAKYDFRLFFRYGLMVEVPKTAILLAIGYFVGDAYQKIAVYLDYVGAFSSVLFAGVLAFAFYYWKKSKKK